MLLQYVKICVFGNSMMSLANSFVHSVLQACLQFSTATKTLHISYYNYISRAPLELRHQCSHCARVIRNHYSGQNISVSWIKLDTSQWSAGLGRFVEENWNFQVTTETTSFPPGKCSNYKKSASPKNLATLRLGPYCDINRCYSVDIVKLVICLLLLHKVEEENHPIYISQI